MTLAFNKMAASNVVTPRFYLPQGRLAAVQRGELEGVGARAQGMADAPAILDVAAGYQVFTAGLKSKQLALLPVFIFTYANFVLRDPVSVLWWSYHASEPTITGPVQSIHAPA